MVDSKQIASGFNEYFVHVGNNMATYLPSVCNSAMSYLPPAQVQSLFVTPTMQDEIEDEKKIEAFKSNWPLVYQLKFKKFLDA